MTDQTEEMVLGLVGHASFVDCSLLGMTWISKDTQTETLLCVSGVWMLVVLGTLLGALLVDSSSV